MKARNSSAIAANLGLSARKSRVRPVTSCAPGSNSRSGWMYWWYVRPVGRRSTSSTQPISTTRLPFFHSRPVVSVSRTIWRMVGNRESGIGNRESGIGNRERLQHGPRGGLELDGLVAGEHVDALVVGIARMPLHPAPVDAVASGRRVQALPEVAVLDRAAAGGLPVAAQPVGHPFGDALAHVLRVGVQDHAA